MDRLGGNRCQFINCRKTKRLNRDVRFFRFPTKNEALCKQWVTNSGNASLSELSTRQLRARTVCQYHFNKNSFYGKRKLLHRDAVPSESELDLTAITDAQKETCKLKALSEMCRCCLKTDVPLSESCHDPNRKEPLNHISKIICCFSDMELENTSSCALCDRCVDSLNNAYRFKQTVWKANLILADYLKELQQSDDSYNKLNGKLEKLRNKMPQCENETTLAPDRRNDFIEFEKVEVLESNDDAHETLDEANNPLKLESFMEYEEHNLTLKREDDSDSVCETDEPTISEPTDGTYDACESIVKLEQREAPDETNGIEPIKNETSSKMYDEIWRLPNVELPPTEDNETDSTYVTHVCEHCGETFTNAVELIQHLTNVHSDKPFGCEPSNESFVFHKGIDDTSKCRSDMQKPYKCEHCLQTFVHLNNYKLHRRVHANVTNRLKCPECDKSFAGNTNLQRHVRSCHKPKVYQCVDCSRSFFYRSNLRIHSRCHLSEKLFQCDSCDLSFVQRGSFGRHKLMHVKEKTTKTSC